jgi:hypothetical protein
MFLKSSRPEHTKFLDLTQNDTCVPTAFLPYVDGWVIGILLRIFSEDGWAIETPETPFSVKYLKTAKNI